MPVVGSSCRRRARSRGLDAGLVAAFAVAGVAGDAAGLDPDALDRLARERGAPRVEMLSLCRGPYAGVRPSDEELEHVLELHRAWLAAGRAEAGERADLCKAELHWRDLGGRDLSYANLEGAVLHGAKLRGAILRNAKLKGAALDGADLGDADLSGADLQGASFYHPHPGRTSFAGSVLRNADLRNVNLSGYDLRDLDLRGALLGRAALIRSDLRGSDLSEANLRGALLYGARLDGASLASAVIVETDLRAATLVDADLRAASLDPAAVEPGSLFGVRGLSEVVLEDPGALVELREALARSGLRTQHRALVSAQRKHQLRSATTSERIFQVYVLGGALSDFGAKPWRAIALLGCGVILFAVVYVVPLRIPRESGGIWRVGSAERLPGSGRDAPELVRCLSLIAAIRIGLLFSLISAFRVGWRDLNAGEWIARLQPREYGLRANGWVRSVAGIQSLLSVYLLALWALCYFGTPFE